MIVIEWESGRGNRYANGTEKGTEVLENAIFFHSMEEAEQELNSGNYGDHCYIFEYED